jgi:PAS domain-containing protein
MERGIWGRGETPEGGEGGLDCLIRGVSDIVTVFEVDGVLRYANAALERILGYRSQDLVGDVPLDLLQPDDAERAIGKLPRSRRAWEQTCPSRVGFGMRTVPGASWRRWAITCSMTQT